MSEHEESGTASQRAIELPDEAPFDVGEEIEVGDLSTVQDVIMPAAKGVLIEIRKAAVKSTNDMGMKYLNLQMVLPFSSTMKSPLTFHSPLVYSAIMNLL